MPELQDAHLQRRNRFWIITVLIFATIYSLISLVNHYNYRTYAYDLGLETNAAYDYAHLRVNDCMMMTPAYSNYLSDHFSIDLIFISPVIYLFGSYGLLVAQIVIILVGGIGVYKYVLHRSRDIFISNMALIHFYIFWGIFTALSFDFHNNVIGAMAVPWIFYFVSTRQLRRAAYAFAWLILSKENMALWAFAILSGMAFTYRKDSKVRNLLLAGSAVSLVYFFFVVNFIIPWLANAGRHYNHLHYTALGNSFGEIITKLIKTPHVFIDLLFNSTNNDPSLAKVKTEMLMFLLLSGGFALIYKPHYFWMILPLLAQKLFNDDPVKWGVGQHYSVEFAPILSIAVYEFAEAYIANKKFRRIAIFLATSLAIITTFSVTTKNHSQYFSYLQVRFYDKEHYKTPYDVKEVNNALKLIPSNAKVCVTQSVGAHLSLRDFIYVYPNIADAEYLAILLNGSYYPIGDIEMNSKVEELRKDQNWKLIYDKNSTLIFKRAGGSNSDNR